MPPAGTLLGKRPRYKKIIAETTDLEEFFVHSFLRTTKKAPRRLVLDFDATDDRLPQQSATGGGPCAILSLTAGERYLKPPNAELNHPRLKAGGYALVG